MNIKPWTEHKAEMLHSKRQEWLQVVAISLGMVAASAMLAYLIA